MKQVIRRTDNQVFHDEISEDGFYLLTENGKDFFLTKRSDGTFEWSDFGTRESAGYFDNFEQAVSYALKPGNELLSFGSRRGLLATLFKRTEENFKKDPAWIGGQFGDSSQNALLNQ